MAKYRVLVVTSIHPDFDKRVWRHARSLVALGHHVTLICPWQISNGMLHDGVKFVTFRPRRNRLSRMLVVPWIIAILTLKFAPKSDIVHFHDLDILPVMAMFSLFTPVVYDIHENYAQEMLTRSWIPCSARKLLYYAVKYGQLLFCNIIGNLVLVAPSQSEEFSSGRYRLAEIRNYAPRSFAKFESDPYQNRPITVLFTGSQYKENGSLLFLEIAHRSIQRNPKLKFLCCGTFYTLQDRDDFWALYEHYNLHKIVEVIQPVPYNKLTELLRRGTIAVLPNLRVNQQIMLIPTKLFEYMAAGLPIVCSDLPFQREVVKEGNCGLIVDPSDPDSFVEAILKVAADPEWGKELGSNGRRLFLAKYTWETEMAKLERFYDEIMGDGTPIEVI